MYFIFSLLNVFLLKFVFLEQTEFNRSNSEPSDKIEYYLP